MILCAAEVRLKDWTRHSVLRVILWVNNPTGCAVLLHFSASRNLRCCECHAPGRRHKESFFLFKKFRQYDILLMESWFRTYRALGQCLFACIWSAVVNLSQIKL
jgi:hypothetical protein